MKYKQKWVKVFDNFKKCFYVVERVLDFGIKGLV